MYARPLRNGTEGCVFAMLPRHCRCVSLQDGSFRTRHSLRSAPFASLPLIVWLHVSRTVVVDVYCKRLSALFFRFRGSPPIAQIDKTRCCLRFLVSVSRVLVSFATPCTLLPPHCPWCAGVAAQIFSSAENGGGYVCAWGQERRGEDSLFRCRLFFVAADAPKIISGKDYRCASLQNDPRGTCALSLPCFRECGKRGMGSVPV
jgi:hypothetical protein